MRWVLGSRSHLRYKHIMESSLESLESPNLNLRFCASIAISHRRTNHEGRRDPYGGVRNVGDRKSKTLNPPAAIMRPFYCWAKPSTKAPLATGEISSPRYEF